MLSPRLVAPDAPPKAAPGPTSAVSTFLLESLVCNVHSTAMQIAKVALMLVRVCSGEKNPLRSGRNSVQDNGKAMLLGLQHAGNVGLKPELVARLVRLYTEVGAAKRKLAPLLKAEGWAPQSLLQGHCEAWRRIALETAATIVQLQQASGASLNPTYASDATALRLFLEQAAGGAIGVINDGDVDAVAAPKLQQRRETPRLSIKRVCILFVAEGPVKATIEDVSIGGLGIVCDATLSLRQQVTVALEDGRKLKAVVARRQGR